MNRLSKTAALALCAALSAALPAPRVPAQQTTAPPASGPQGVKVPTDTGTPTLSVATVRLDNGWRASKLIGSTIRNEQNQEIGTLDDLILVDTDKIVVAIISVGGILGIGSKLVAIPYDQIRFQDGKAMLPGATKEVLKGMPCFTYGNG